MLSAKELQAVAFARNYNQLCAQWIKEGNFIDSGTPATQAGRIEKSFRELSLALNGEKYTAKDEIGRSFVAVMLISTSYGLDVAERLQSEMQAALDGFEYTRELGDQLRILSLVCSKLGGAITAQDHRRIKQFIGVYAFELYCLASLLGIRFPECLENAWNEFKDCSG